MEFYYQSVYAILTTIFFPWFVLKQSKESKYLTKNDFDILILMQKRFLYISWFCCSQKLRKIDKKYSIWHKGESVIHWGTLALAATRDINRRKSLWTLTWQSCEVHIASVTSDKGADVKRVPMHCPSDEAREQDQQPVRLCCSVTPSYWCSRWQLKH